MLSWIDARCAVGLVLERIPEKPSRFEDVLAVDIARRYVNGEDVKFATVVGHVRRASGPFSWPCRVIARAIGGDDNLAEGVAACVKVALRAIDVMYRETHPVDDDAAVSIEGRWRIRDWTRSHPIEDIAHASALRAWRNNDPNGARAICEAVLKRVELVCGDRFQLELLCPVPGECEIVVTIDGAQLGRVPFDNAVKARTRLDPEHAAESEKQIAELRAQLSRLSGQIVDQQALGPVMQQLEATRAERDSLREAARRAEHSADAPSERMMRVEEQLRLLTETVTDLKNGPAE